MNRIQRMNIDENPLIKIIDVRQHRHGRTIPEPGNAKQRPVRIRRLEKIRLRQFLRSHFLEPLIIGPHHHQIHIIVPRHETPVTHRPQKRPPRGEITQMVFLTDALQFRQHIELDIPDALTVRRHQKA